MQVKVQKSTRTTQPRNAAGSSGSELSHATAPSSEGMWSRSNMRLIARSPHSPERGAEFLGKQLRLLPGCEVASAVHLVEVDGGGIRALDPAAGTPPDLVREGGERDRDGHVRNALVCRARLTLGALPVGPARGGAGTGEPVQRDVVEDLVPREVARGPPVHEGAGDLVVAVGVVVGHPGGEGDRGVNQRVADRLRPAR